MNEFVDFIMAILVEELRSKCERERVYVMDVIECVST